MTRVEFRLQNKASKRAEDIGRTEMSSVPVVGELVNVDGDPFIVVDRGWALTTVKNWYDIGIAGRGDLKVYAYLTVVPAGAKQ